MVHWVNGSLPEGCDPRMSHLTDHFLRWWCNIASVGGAEKWVTKLKAGPMSGALGGGSLPEGCDPECRI